MNNIAEILKNTWNYHGGIEATVKGMEKNLKEGYPYKQEIRDKFLGGKDKIKFTTKNINIPDTSYLYNFIRGYAKRKKAPRSIFWVYLQDASDEFISHILANKKITPDMRCFNFFMNLIYGINRIQVDIEKATKLNFTSPKLTKQIITIFKECDLDTNILNSLLSDLSVVQSLQLADTSEVTIVISTDPIDFITASLNDYGWTSCVVPSACHAGMPLSLYQDRSTAIAYIESEQSEFILYRKKDGTMTGSNKKMRRFIHFTEDYKGVILNNTYPNINFGFDQALLQFFAQFEMYPVTDYEYDELITRITYNDEFLYEDLSNNSKICPALGCHDTDIIIGETAYCVGCGAPLSSYVYDDAAGSRGVCDNCYDAATEEEEEDY